MPKKIIGEIVCGVAYDMLSGGAKKKCCQTDGRYARRDIPDEY